MKILGIDPGTSLVGWGLIETTPQIKSISYGCIENSKNDPQEIRLKNIYEQLTQIIKLYKPDAVSVEDLFFTTNAKTAISVGQARGVILLAGVYSNKQVESYTPLQVKLAICGSGRAEKKQVQQMVKTLLKLATVPKPDDTADALAIALTHAFSYKMKQKTI